MSDEFGSRIDRIEVTLSHAVDAIEKITALVTQPQKTQWGPIMTAVGLLFVAGGGYTTLITTPMMRDNDQLRAELILMKEREMEFQRDIGRIEGRLGIKIDE